MLCQTQNRQDAVRKLTHEADVILVVGSKNSSNSNRLKEVAVKGGVAAYLIDDSSDIDPIWFEGKSHIGITAGASAPEKLVEDVVYYLKLRFDVTYREMPGVEKQLHFSPADIRRGVEGSTS